MPKWIEAMPETVMVSKVRDSDGFYSATVHDAAGTRMLAFPQERSRNRSQAIAYAYQAIASWFMVRALKGAE